MAVLSQRRVAQALQQYDLYDYILHARRQARPKSLCSRRHTLFFVWRSFKLTLTIKEV